MSSFIKFFVVFTLTIIISSCIGIRTEFPPPEYYPIPQFIYRTMTIQIQPTIDHTPSMAQLVLLKSRMNEYDICPIDGIDIIINSPAYIYKNKWIPKDLRNFEKRYRTIYDRNPSDQHLYIFIGYVAGYYDMPDMDNVAGLAMGGNLIIYFDRFPSYIEGSVLVHEIGHRIGLVNRAMREGDPINGDRPKHCNVQSCVMYWKSNYRAQFDELCQKDIDRLKLRILGYPDDLAPQECCNVQVR